MLDPIYEKKFSKEVKLSEKRGKDLQKLRDIIALLCEEKQLPRKNLNHKLQDEYKGCWECHIEPDWLLIYRKTSAQIIFIRTGSHSDLF